MEDKKGMIDEELIKEIEENVIEEKGEHYQKEVSVTSDGKQFDIKIPKKISDAVKMKKGNKFRFHLLPKDGDFDLKIEFIK